LPSIPASLFYGVGIFACYSPFLFRPPTTLARVVAATTIRLADTHTTSSARPRDARRSVTAR
jgi:hypothetical protein